MASAIKFVFVSTLLSVVCATQPGLGEQGPHNDYTRDPRHQLAAYSVQNIGQIHHGPPTQVHNTPQFIPQEHVGHHHPQVHYNPQNVYTSEGPSSYPSHQNNPGIIQHDQIRHQEQGGEKTRGEYFVNQGVNPHVTYKVQPQPPSPHFSGGQQQQQHYTVHNQQPQFDEAPRQPSMRDQGWIPIVGTPKAAPLSPQYKKPVPIHQVPKKYIPYKPKFYSPPNFKAPPKFNIIPKKELIYSHKQTIRIPVPQQTKQNLVALPVAEHNIMIDIPAPFKIPETHHEVLHVPQEQLQKYLYGIGVQYGTHQQQNMAQPHRA